MLLVPWIYLFHPSPNSNGGIILLGLIAIKMLWPIDACLSWESINDFMINSKDGGKVAVPDSKYLVLQW